jgi:DNA-directed RNA polymerase specialized sigma24 family protein
LPPFTLKINDKLNQTFTGLPKRQDKAIYLKYYEVLTFGEVAHVMNLN